MKIKFKKIHPDAVIPFKIYDVDAGFDLTATSIFHDENFIEYGTGITFEIPVGYCGMLLPRSSITKMGLMLKNSVGIIDCSYRGEIKLRFLNLLKNCSDGSINNTSKIYKIGERIGQIVFVPIPNVVLEESNELSETMRNDGGYGSTGN